jgi:hypothetical protein
MQKDFTAMAQGQQQPTEEVTMEERKGSAEFVKSLPTMEGMGKEGLPTGDSREDIKARILGMLEKLGLMEMFDTPAKQQELAMNIDALITAYENDDAKAIESNPIIQLITEASSKPEPEQPQQQAGPTDFSAMVPPGGGMSGR